MIFDFLKKQKGSNRKTELIKIMITSVNIPEQNKFLYIEALDVLDKDWLDNLYNDLTKFTEIYEIKQLDKITKENFSLVTWMKKKEALEKQKEINAFSFLINNI